MSLNKEQISEILWHYANPLVEHRYNESCGHCQKMLIDKRVAEEELEKAEPSYYAFLRKSSDIWKDSKHYKAWQEISRTIPKEMEKDKRIKMITEKMREIGLEP